MIQQLPLVGQATSSPLQVLESSELLLGFCFLCIFIFFYRLTLKFPRFLLILLEA
jgi:hypothetical protein